MVGNASVGKTTIVHMLRDKIFDPNTESTVGIEFNPFPIEIDGRQLSLQIWDTAGQELYRSLSRSYYREAIGVFLVFSFDSHPSFEHLNEWINDVKTLCHPKAIIFLVGNKNDLVEERQVTTTEAEQFAEAHGLEFFETSAKNNYNIKEMIYHAAAVVYQAIHNGEIDVVQSLHRISIEEEFTEEEKAGCC